LARDCVGMSQENMAVLGRALDAFNRRDRAAWLVLNDPEVEVIPARDWPESDAIRGREAVWDFYVGVIGALRDGVLEDVELVEAGDDGVVQHLRGELQGTESGASVVFSYWSVTTFRNGRLLRVNWFTERGEALEAAGLRE
jgi:ketosteroid isomerase-like protein